MKDLITAKERLNLPLFPIWVYKAINYASWLTLIIIIFGEMYHG